MSETIRAIEPQDLPEVAKLWSPPPSVDTLKWLWADPDNPDQLHAFVAINNDQIIGVIAYTVASYTYAGQVIKGIFPFSWKVDPHHKGFAGIALMRKVLYSDVFSFAIGGTEYSKKFFDLFKFNQVTERFKFYKVFNPIDFYRSMQGSRKRRILKTCALLPSCFKPRPKKTINNDIALINHVGDMPEIQVYNDIVMQRQLSNNYLKWLDKCPDCKIHIFHIQKGTTKIGMFIASISHYNNTRIGRMVHISHLGNDQKLWKNTIQRIFEFFLANHCCAVLAVSSEKNANIALSALMQKFMISEPVLIRDTMKKTVEYDMKQWHIQFSEGDTAFLKD